MALELGNPGPKSGLVEEGCHGEVVLLYTVDSVEPVSQVVVGLNSPECGSVTAENLVQEVNEADRFVSDTEQC